MKFMTGLLAAVLLLAGMGVSQAVVRIAEDRGGRIGTYVDRYQDVRSSGEMVIIDKTGALFIPPKFDQVSAFFNGLASITVQERYQDFVAHIRQHEVQDDCRWGLLVRDC